MTPEEKIKLIDQMIADGIEFGKMDSGDYLKCLVDCVSTICWHDYKPSKRPSLHEFVGKEREKYEAFRKHHFAYCDNPGDYDFSIRESGLGQAIKIKCPICGEESDITDTSMW